MIVILKILLIFALILFLLWRKWPLGPVMLTASFLLGIIFGLPFSEMGRSALRSALDFSTSIYLIIILYLIAVLENLLRTEGLLSRMVSALKILFRDHRLVASFMPAFIGFLPSAGGAMFSAPLVKEATHGMGLSPGRQTFINYWYRHIWEAVFPLYPGLLLAAVLAGCPVADLIYRQWPYTLGAVLIGWLVGWRGIKRDISSGTSGYGKAWKEVLVTMSPVLFVIIAVLVFKFDLALMTGLAVLGLLIGLRYHPKRLPGLLWESFKPMTLLLIIGVMVFKGMLEASGAIRAFSEILVTTGIPKTVVVSALPFMVGLLTGISQGYVAVAFPLLLGIFGPLSGSLSWYVLAYVAGLGGVLISPSHLCLALTRDYFEAGWEQVYGYLLPASGGIVLLGFLLYHLWP
jgi:integral membrane protein (TIGR00529 family)